LILTILEEKAEVLIHTVLIKPSVHLTLPLLIAQFHTLQLCIHPWQGVQHIVPRNLTPVLSTAGAAGWATHTLPAGLLGDDGVEHGAQHGVVSMAGCVPGECPTIRIICTICLAVVLSLHIDI